MKNHLAKGHALALLTLMCAPIAHADSEIENQKAATIAAAQIATSQNTVAISENDYHFLDSIVNNTAMYVDRIKKSLEDFFNTHDKRSYNYHVDGFKKTLSDINRDVYMPLDHAAKQADSAAPFYRTADSIVKELCRGLEEVYRVLEKNRGTSNALSLGVELDKAKNNCKARLQKLVPAIDSLADQVNEERMTLKGKILSLGANLRKLLSAAGGGKMEILGKIRHRLNCK